MQVYEIANVSIGLSQTPASVANFGVGMILVDHADVPIDRRYKITTRSEYSTYFTAGTSHLSWLTTHWSQNYNPATAYVGRWVSANSAPYFVCQDTNLTNMLGVADGSMTVTSDAGADILTTLDFDDPTITTLAHVATVFQTALDAGGVSGVDCFVDKEGRLVFEDSVADATGLNTVVITASGAGTDITGATYLSVATGFAQAGVAAEAPETALGLILELDNTPFGICERGCSIAQKVSLSTAVEALDKTYLCVVNDTDAKSSSATTDAGYLINALGNRKTHLEYTEHTTQNPDATLLGEVYPQKTGSMNFALTPIAGVSESGLHADATTVIPLTVSERTNLEAKGYDYLVEPSNLVHFTTGIGAGDVEMRVMVGKMYMAAQISNEIYAYLVANNVVTFSDDDINAFKSIIQKWADEMANRKLLDPDSYVWNMPTAADFTAAQKASHTMTLSDVFTADVQSAVNDVVMTLTFNI